MRKDWIDMSAALPGGLAAWPRRPKARVWIVGALAALLPLMTTVPVESQSGGASDPGQTGPGQTGPGRAAPWSVEGSPNPHRRPVTDRRQGDRERDEFWSKMGKFEKGSHRLRCQILELEELGRIYVQEPSGGSPFWIQLPPEVKIRTDYPGSFGGRKKLALPDLEVGQRLVVKVRNGEEIVKVTVTPAKV